MKKTLIIALWLLIACIAKSQNTAPLPAGNTKIGGFLTVGYNNEVWSSSPSLYFNYSGSAKTTYFWNLKGSKGKPILSLLDSGNVGIGTANPKDKLHIKLGESGTNPYENSGLTIENSKRVVLQLLSPLSSDQYLMFGNTNNSNRAWISYNHNNDEMNFTHYNKAGNFLFANGNVGINTNMPNHKLDVNGTIRANEIIVSNPSTADFVFEKNYKLKSLTEVEKFITQNKHLPDVASAKQMKKNGVKQGEMNAKLLQKIEELTLYMIQLKKENEELKKSNNSLVKTSKTLSKRIQKLENKH